MYLYMQYKHGWDAYLSELSFTVCVVNISVHHEDCSHSTPSSAVTWQQLFPVANSYPGSYSISLELLCSNHVSFQCSFCFFLLFFFYIFLPKPVLEKDYFHCFSLGCKFQRFSETFVPFLVLISILMLEDAYIFIYSTRLSFSVITLIYSNSG